MCILSHLTAANRQPFEGEIPTDIGIWNPPKLIPTNMTIDFYNLTGKVYDKYGQAMADNKRLLVRVEVRRDEMKIELYRGDTEKIKVSFYRGWYSYVPKDLSDGDVFTFTVRDRKTRELIFSKTAIYPNDIIDIKHTDTKDLELKTYIYDVQYKTPDRKVVKTLIKNDLVIHEDVTREE